METQTYWIKARACQPLLLSQRVKGNENTLESDTYIAGSTLRGALAYGWLGLDSNDQNPQFQSLFVEEQAAFSNLYPALTDDNGNLLAQSAFQYGPLPETAQSCKRFPGFGGDEGHGVSDHLFRLSSEHVDGVKGQNYREHFEKCTTCESSYKRFEGYFGYSQGAHTRAKQVQVKRSLMTRSAVNSMLESVQTGQLYSMDVVEENTVFLGKITLKDGAEPGLLKEIKTLRVGTGKTRGMGKIEIEFIDSIREPQTPQEHLCEIQDRLQKIQEKAGAAGAIEQEGRFWVTLDLQSPLLLRDRWMRNRLTLEESDLTPYGTGVNWNSGKALYFAKSTLVGGWNGLLQHAKEERQALQIGGVILLSVEGRLDDVSSALQRLENFGLGERLGEGYGQITVCHPFHLDFFPES